ncbi:Zinc metalloprotease TldD [uncultured archaeon]|nr:Zinc metalloprotease TldD [uncultured archaeon]
MPEDGIMDSDKISSALSKLNFYADVRLASGATSAFSIEDGKVAGTQGEISGIGVRALVHGSFGYAWSTRISDFPELLKKAERLARVNKGKSQLSPQQPAVAECGENFRFPDVEEKLSMLREAEKTALSEKAKNATVSLRDSNVEKTFVSSEGARIAQKQSYVYFAATSIAKEGAQIQRGIDRLASRTGYEKMDFIKAAQEARESAERLLKSEPPPRGRFPVIMNPEMTGVFSHEAVGHASEGDSIVERESVFAGKLGKKLGSEKVSITDDPAFNDFGQYSYDDEGVKAQSVPIIEAGVLSNYLHSRQSAFSLKAPSNGHARAQGYDFAPIVRMSNTLFSKGGESESEVFDVKEGLYAIGMKGGSVDIFSGDFMFAAKEAWLVKNGSKEKFLRDVTISGNILETLARVESVGKDWGTSPGFCGKFAQSAPVSDGGPHIRVSELKIG